MAEIYYWVFIIVSIINIYECCSHVFLYRKVKDKSVTVVKGKFIKQYVAHIVYVFSVVSFVVLAAFDLDYDHIVYPLAILGICFHTLCTRGLYTLYLVGSNDKK